MTTGRWLLCAVAALGSCKNHSLLDDPSGHESAAGSATGSASQSTDAPPKRQAVTTKRLAPLSHELGIDHVVPTSIVIELATPIVDADHIGAVSAQSVVKLEPEIAGTLTYSGVSELTFTPARPFAFDTSYKLELDKLETHDGVLQPAAGERWAYEFKTPEFKFLSWAPIALDLIHHKVTTEVTFSGTVLPNLARAQMAFAIDGRSTTAMSMLPSHQQNTVLVQLTDPGIKLGSKLSLTIAKTLPSLLGTRAAAAHAEYVVSDDKTIEIKSAFMVEGANGYYMEVVCNDAAAPAGHRYVYEGEGYYDLSQRCQLTDESVSRIHFSPPVKKTYITNGRAGFRVFGDFKRGAYAVKIDGGATTVDGGVLLAPFARSFSVAARKPQLSFTGPGRDLPRTAWNNLGVKHLNTDEVNLIVREVPQENLIFWLGNDGTDAADERTSNVILKKTIQLHGDPDVPGTTWVDVASLLPSTTRGVLELKLVGVGSQATARLLLTNLSLVAKKTAPPARPWEQHVQVWALGIDSTELLDGVDVSLVRKSGKVVARCSTSGGKGCALDVRTDDDPDQTPPFALIARKGDDLTYIRYTDLKADVAESNTSGIPFVTENPYRAAMYSDRGVYRPGDTAHVVAIVRDAKDRAPDKALPVDVKVIDPRAKVVRKLALKTNAAGEIAIDHALPAFADTGHWRVAMTVADKPLVAYDLQVEEFVPERMRVTAAPEQPDVQAGQPVNVDVTAQYLFGGSAAGSGIELTCSVEPTRFAPKENGELTYGVAPKGKAVSLGTSTKSALDPKGTATIACPAQDASSPFAATSKVNAMVSVLEAGSGRATVKTTHLMVHPEKYYLGLKTKANRAKAGETFSVEGMVVDWNGKLSPSAINSVDIELVHLEADYGYGYDDDSGDGRYDRWLRAVPEGKQTARVAGGKFTFDVTPGEADIGYVVRVRSGKAKSEITLDGTYPYDYYYGYGYGERVDQTPRPAKPTQLTPQLAKEIEVGKPVDVKVLTPYAGKILWTVETDHVVTAEWKDVARGESAWSFTLDAYAPNVYVSAFIVKDPHLESKDAFLPDRAFGVTSARVLPIEFTAEPQDRGAERGPLVEPAHDQAGRRADPRSRVRDGRRGRRGHPIADQLPDAGSTRAAVREACAGRRDVRDDRLDDAASAGGRVVAHGRR